MRFSSLYFLKHYKFLSLIQLATIIILLVIHWQKFPPYWFGVITQIIFNNFQQIFESYFCNNEILIKKKYQFINNNTSHNIKRIIFTSSPMKDCISIFTKNKYFQMVSRNIRKATNSKARSLFSDVTSARP